MHRASLEAGSGRSLCGPSTHMNDMWVAQSSCPHRGWPAPSSRVIALHLYCKRYNHLKSLPKWRLAQVVTYLLASPPFPDRFLCSILLLGRRLFKKLQNISSHIVLLGALKLSSNHFYAQVYTVLLLFLLLLALHFIIIGMSLNLFYFCFVNCFDCVFNMKFVTTGRQDDRYK